MTISVPTGERIKAARLSLGLSRRQLAEDLPSISEHQLLNIERGRRLSDVEAIEVVDALGARGASLDPAHGDEAPPAAPSLPVSPPESVQAIRATRSWSGSTQTSVPLGPVRLGPIRQVSNSEVAAWLDCRRKWWLQWYRGLTPLRESAVGPRAIGDRVHRALQEYYVPDGQVPTHPADALERLIVEDWTTLTQGGLGTADVEKQFSSEANLERAMVAGYFEWLTETGADVGLVVVAPEQYVEATLLTADENGGRRVDVIGKMDVRVIRESDGVRRFMDHKTVGEFARARQRVILGDPQMLHYHLLEWLSTEEGEARCEGALLNMLRRVKRTAAAKPPFYERLDPPANRHQVENYRVQLEGTVTDMLQAEDNLAVGLDHRGVVYPHKTNDCSWKCDFVAVCPMFDDGSRAEAMLAQLYTVRDPLTYYQGANAGTTQEGN